jgi:hypothetical protein
MEIRAANPRLGLQRATAKLVPGLEHSIETPPVADRALVNGEYPPALAELAAIGNPTMSDVEPLFSRALVEMGLSMPPRADSGWLMVRHCTEQIAANAESLGAAFLLRRETSDAVSDVLPDRRYMT